MKKIVLMVAVMMIAAPAMATINFAVTDHANGTFTVSYTTDAGDEPRGVAVRVTVVGANITGVLSDDPAFNARIDHMWDNPGHGLGQGNMAAKDGGPGNAVLPNDVIVISGGVLDIGGGQLPGPGTSTDLMTLQTDMEEDSTATVSLTADGLRGPNSGVVGSVIPSNLDPLAGSVTDVLITYPPSYTGCFPQGHADYDQWVAMGVLIGREDGLGPDCWCGSGRHCYGDADASIQGYTFTGYEYVGTNDLGILATAWGTLEPDNVSWGPVGPGIATITSGGFPGICADFDHAKQGYTFTGYEYVGTNDLGILATSWGTLEPNPVTWGPTGDGIPADCFD